MRVIRQNNAGIVERQQKLVMKPASIKTSGGCAGHDGAKNGSLRQEEDDDGGAYPWLSHAPHYFRQLQRLSRLLQAVS